MKSLKDLLIKKDVRPVSLFEKDIFFVFQKIIQGEYGNSGAEKLKADYFKNKTLFVKSSSGSFGSELWLNQGKIIRKINEELGSEVVRKIKIK